MRHLIACVASFALVASACAQRYELTVLGTYGQENSACNFINDSGDVLGYTWTSLYGLPPLIYGFRYREGVMTPLQPLPGYVTSGATSESGSGVAVGWCTGGYEGDPHAAQWDAKGIVSEIVGFLKGFYNYSLASGINDAGQIILNVGYSPQGAFLWEEAKLTQILPLHNSVRVSDINNQGTVSGYVGSSVHRAFRWKKGGAVFMPGQITYSRSYGINELGWIVGERDQRPVIWRDDSVIELSTAGFPFGFADGINDLGQAIGRCYYQGGPSRSFLWSGGKTIPIDSLFPFASRNIQLTASSINNHGVICGTLEIGYTRSRGFILTPVR